VIRQCAPDGASATSGSADEPEAPAILFDKVSLAFDDQIVLRDVSFAVRTGHVTTLLGASGAGKSVVLKLIMGLLKPDSGIIRVEGKRIDNLGEAEMMHVRGSIGMLFQESALFDSLTVADNVGYRLYEETDTPAEEVRQRVEEVLGFVGLAEFVDRMPAELSGGQRRRVAIARAMATKPRLLLLDSPTSGLDPITSKTVDAETIKLRDLEHVTPLMVTHQLEDAYYVANHRAVLEHGRVAIVPADQRKADLAEFLMLKDGRIQVHGSAEELRRSEDPYLKRFVS
jgi:phospholipid/cholesterol/gamma-HCH transport system ATP-binding protein